jgi:PAS domain S-box-containing protein
MKPFSHDINGDIGICRTDENMNFVDVNDSVCHLLGYSKSDLIGISYLQIIPREDHKKYSKTYKKLLYGTEGSSENRLLIDKNGDLIDVQIATMKVEFEDGHKELITSIKDLKSLNAYRSNVLGLVSELDEIQKLGHLGTWTFNGVTGDIWWSDEVYHIFEREIKNGPPSFEEISTKYYGDFQDAHNKAIEESVTKKTELYMEVPLRTDKGAQKWIAFHMRPLQDGGEPSDTFIGVVQDITDRRIYQNRYEVAIDGANLGIWEFDFASGETYTNDRWWTMLGYEKDEFPYSFENWHALVHPADKKIPFKEMERMSNGGDPRFSMTLRLKTKNGNYRTLLCTGKSVSYNEDGSIRKMIGTHSDLTDSIDLNKKYDRVLEQNQIAIVGGNVGLYEFDLRSKTLEVNDIFFNMHGYENSKINDKWDFYLNILHPDDRGIPVKVSEDTEKKEIIDFEKVLRIRNRKGKWEWVKSKGKVIEWDEELNPLIISGSHVDITSEKENEIALKESEHNYRFLAETIPHVLWVANPAGDITYINKYGLNYFGKQKKDLLNWSWTSVVHPDDLVEVADKWNSCLYNKTNYENRQRMLNSAGEYEWFNVTAKPNIDEDGNVDTWVGLSTNIHDSVIATKDLEERERLLSAMMDNFPRSYISVIDKNFDVIYSGGEEFKLQNLNPNDFVGINVKDVFDIYGEDVKNKILNAYHQTFEGQNQNFELEIPDQVQFYKTIGLTNIKGETESILTVAENITEKKNAEIELFERQRLLSAITSSFPRSYVLVINKDKRIILAKGPEFERKGLDPLKYEGKELYSLFTSLNEKQSATIDKACDFTLNGYN